MYIYICIYIFFLFIANFSSILNFSQALRLSINQISPYKLAFHYSPAWKIVSRIMPVTRGDFLYNYFICNISTKDSR